MTKAKDIVPLFGDAYSFTAPNVLGDQHGALLDSLEAHLAKSNRKNLVVLGCGGTVLPYSVEYTPQGVLGDSNRDRMKQMIGDGRIVFLDYVVDEKQNGLMKARKTLEDSGFFDSGYFQMGGFVQDGSIVDIDSLPESSISFVVGNLRDPLKFAKRGADAVDANLSIHHASITREELSRIYWEISKLLGKGGMLHLGEGEVDMNYTEDKIIRISEDLSRIAEGDVLICDDREKSTGYTPRYHILNGVRYKGLRRFRQSGCEKNLVTVEEDGTVVLYSKDKTAGHIMDEMKKKGYASAELFAGNSFVRLPLIDENMPEDVASHIAPVEAYYAAIKSRVIKGYGKSDPELAKKICTGIGMETANARKGTVEYYMGEKKILKALKENGFKVTRGMVKHHDVGPFYNITAIKR